MKHRALLSEHALIERRANAPLGGDLLLPKLISGEVEASGANGASLDVPKTTPKQG